LNAWKVHVGHKDFFKRKKVKSPKNIDKCKELDGFMCRICGSTEQIGTHHIINRSLGGDDSLFNLITLCFSHHRKLHDGHFDLTEWLISMYESHPRPIWFRWLESMEELKKRGNRC
jgi:hypothetical protein